MEHCGAMEPGIQQASLRVVEAATVVHARRVRSAWCPWRRRRATSAGSIEPWLVLYALHGGFAHG
jgi:hypothetical protein